MLATVTTPSTATLPLPRRSAAATVTTGGSEAPGRGRAVGVGLGGGTGQPAHIARIAQPEPIAVELPTSRRALTHDADEMQPVPASGEARLETAGAGGAGAKRRPGRVHQPEHEVAARLADDRGIERRVERHEASLHELAERCCSDRERIRERRQRR